MTSIANLAERPMAAGDRFNLARSQAARLLFIPSILVWLGAFACVRPLATPDEGRYSHIARWMTQSGDWLIPRIDGLPFLHKPPLYYWLEALVIEAFGVHLLSLRLVSLLAALMTCACVYILVRRYEDAGAARWSVAVLVSSPLFFAAAQFANLDMLVSSFVTLTLTLAVIATQAQGGAARLFWLGAYVAAALGFLSKGLIAIAFPGGAFVLWSVIKRRPDFLRQALSPLGLALFVLITVPWFWAVERHFPGFIRYFFVYHHFERFLTDEFNGHYGIWFYPAIVAAGLLPWSLALPFTLRSSLPTRHLSEKLLCLGVVWFTIVIVFFSMPSSKMIGYIFPLLPAAAIIAGPGVSRWRWRWWTLAAAVVVCLGLAVAGPAWQKKSPMALADNLAARIGPDDDVVFMDWLYYDVVVRLDRDRPAYLHGDWRPRSKEIPDSLRRQLIEGREFEPRAGFVLIGHDRLNGLMSRSDRTTWVFVEKQSNYPELAGLAVEATDGRTLLLRAGPDPAHSPASANANPPPAK